MALVAGFTMISTGFALPVASGWLAVMLLFGLLSYRAFAKLPFGDPKLQGGAEFRMCNRHAFASAALWSLPLWPQGGAPGLDNSLDMWASALLRMLAPALIAHSVHSTCLLFLVPVSLSGETGLIRGGARPLADSGR